MDGILEEKSCMTKRWQYFNGYYQSGKIKWKTKNGKRKDYYENGQ